jgi:5-methylcytosine-specific restriction endonuclease McrA
MTNHGAGVHSDAIDADAPHRADMPPRNAVKPLDANLSRIHVTVSRDFMKKLDAARDALSHSKPGATTEEILEAGLDLVLAAHAKRKGLVEKPQKKLRPSKPSHIPAHVRREVWKRDGGRCQFRIESGEICGSTYQVEVDHLTPVALGGVATVDGCRLACAPHNKLAARRIFGDQVMDRYTRRARSRAGYASRRWGMESRTNGATYAGYAQPVGDGGRPSRARWAAGESARHVHPTTGSRGFRAPSRTFAFAAGSGFRARSASRATTRPTRSYSAASVTSTVTISPG